MTVVRLPGSKSVTHRALLLAAAADGPCRVENPLLAGDTVATLDALRRLGYDLREEDGDIVTMPSYGEGAERLDLHNAGTGLRLLTAHAALLPGRTSFVGDASLSMRPHGPLLKALARGGARVEGGPGLPYAIHGPLRAGVYHLPGGVSSQYASALMLALPFLKGHSRLHLEEPVRSRPYLDLTFDVARRFGLRIEPTVDGYVFDGPQRPGATRFLVEGDWSSAAFPIVAACITGQSVRVEGVSADSLQGDKAILDVVASFGAKVNGLQVDPGDLHTPGTLDVSATPDMFPALCILAACARGTTTFTGGEALRDKESDRIAAMGEGLRSLGIEAKDTEDGMVIQGGRFTGGTVACRDDHRIHMAFAVASLVADGAVHLDGEGSVTISYPSFYDDLSRIQGDP